MKEKDKKALSTVVATVLLILLTVVAVTMVWVFVQNFIRNQTDDTCYKVESYNEAVTLNEMYTCFNDTIGSEYLQFSINIKDVEIEELLISILAEGATRSFTITNNDTNVPNVIYYPGISGPVRLPEKNAGLTYIVGGFTGIEKVDWIEIAPTVSGKKCKATDKIKEIESCSLFVG
jgi:hypothetical protein